MRGENKEEVNVRKESKEDSKEEKKNFVLSLPKEEKKIFLLRDEIKNTNDIKIEKEVSMVYVHVERGETEFPCSRQAEKYCQPMFLVCEPKRRKKG